MLDVTDPRRKLFKEDKVDLIPVIFSTDQALAKPSHKIYFSPPANSAIGMSESVKMSVAPTQVRDLGGFQSNLLILLRRLNQQGSMEGVPPLIQNLCLMP